MTEKMWATSYEILAASAKFLLALATRKAQFPTLVNLSVYLVFDLEAERF